jgi:hypothetical protein
MSRQVTSTLRISSTDAHCVREVGLEANTQTTATGKIIFKWILRKQGGEVWTGIIWLRIGIGGGLL